MKSGQSEFWNREEGIGLVPNQWKVRVPRMTHVSGNCGRCAREKLCVSSLVLGCGGVA